MTVKQLRKLLKEYPKETEVHFKLSHQNTELHEIDSQPRLILENLDFNKLSFNNGILEFVVDDNQDITNNPPTKNIEYDFSWWFLYLSLRLLCYTIGNRNESKALIIR